MESRRASKPGARLRLGDILVAEGLITPAQLKQALDFGRSKGLKLGEALEELGLVNEEQVTKALARQLNLPQVDLSKVVIDSSLREVVPEMLARKYILIPIGKKGGELLVAISDPLNVMAVDEVGRVAKAKVVTCIAPKSQIMAAIEKLYHKEGLHTPEGFGEAADSEAVEVVNDFILSAVQREASDIHVEPLESHLRIRVRVDGVLHVLKQLPMELYPSILSRIKVMAAMDIGERRRPQDGRFEMAVAGKEIDFRVSTLPTSKGEKVVMRLLDKSSIKLSLENLGLNPAQHALLDSNLRNPHGMILVTGPTGSGKTTTLYAGLNLLNSIEKNIVTVEDPVEYELEGVSQVQVNPKADLTFANALRSILRQDPDIVMIGEIRDVETAEIAIHAALTGHLVLSTLHTNTSSGAVARLMDMGVQPFLIASSLELVVAQRLVRRLCQDCKEPFDPPDTLWRDLGIEPRKDVTIYRSKGCPLCNNTGYRGRIAIFELMPMNREMERLVMERASSSQLMHEAVKQGMTTLRESGVEKVLEGVTSIDEVLRVTMDSVS